MPWSLSLCFIVIYMFIGQYSKMMMNPAKNNLGPAWLKPMLKARYFRACSLHENENKNECNMFCLDCVGDPFCTLCSVLHRNHQVLQIRRSSYHDVVKVDEIEQHVDISFVQPYVINSAKIVFLNERPLSRPAKSPTIHCETCFRALSDSSFRFCSLRCKLTGIKNGTLNLSFLPKGEISESESYNQFEPPNKKGRSSSSPLSVEKSSSNEDVVASAKKLNSHKRKSVPRRSPFL